MADLKKYAGMEETERDEAMCNDGYSVKKKEAPAKKTKKKK